MTWAIQPEPTDEAERAALLEALGQELRVEGEPTGQRSRWWRSGLADFDLRGGAAPQEPGGEAGVVQP